ncbi:ABC transporter permease [Ekhidna sp. To15]|uniref:ABC transporter permease n=1 Tax=Ekhidna sp. To15 TaxID=3395267 RepID=UPI003F51AD95
MKNPEPPKLAEKFLLLFLKEGLAEEVLGDLDEKFYRTIEKKSLRRAKLNYLYQVFNYLRPFAFKFFKSNSIIPTMIKHNFKISYRVLIKNKVFSAINIGGLAMGMTVAILIGLWIHDELTFNQYHKNYDSIVQVLRKDKEDGKTYVNSSQVSKLGDHLEQTYPTLFNKVAITFYRNRALVLTVGKQSLERLGYFFSPDAPAILSLDIVAGQASLESSDAILLSESLAETLFRDKNPIGEMVQINTSTQLMVNGVYADLPLNSTFGDMEFMLSMELVYNEERPATWNNYNTKIYATLNEEVDYKEASALIKDELNRNIDSEEPMDLLLLPMKDWHLNSSFEDGIQKSSSRITFVRLYAIIGIFVLLLACINFMNLNTARYQLRGKEVGIRKTVGSRRKQLISQFLSESILYATVSFVLTIFIVWLILPWFNGISDKDLSLPWSDPLFWLSGVLFTLFSAIIAGSYPALLLSSFSPLKALTSSIKQGKSNVRLRQSLVVFQFAISMLLMIGMLTIHQQIQHAKARPVGYDQSDLIVARGRSGEYYKKFDILREEILNTGYVEEMASANYPLMNTLGNNDGFRLEGNDKSYPISFNTIYVTPEYGKATKWTLLLGRDFSRTEGDESQNVIVSQSAVEQMRLENPIGKRLVSYEGFGWDGRDRAYTIIGVVKDMIKGSPYESPRPLMLFHSDSEEYAFMRLKKGSSYVEVLPEIEEAFKEVLPGHPFNYEFVDDQYARKFREEEKIGSLATFFSVLAILISCLGLFGLSAFMVEQRTKEIGIRKVLGASVPTLWRLLSKDITLLVFIACVIAIPVSTSLLNVWLENYEYRIEITWWMYVTAAIAGLLIALSTVSYHSIRASLGNPVDALRSE